MSDAIGCQLWMGRLEPYMTEHFIAAAFKTMGEQPTKLCLGRKKFTGESAGYCFLSFATDELAMDVMHKLNGKPIPGSNPIVRFHLNNASNYNKWPGLENDFPVWVGGLTPDVDDYQLYKAFAAKYTSVKNTKVILDNEGFSKGYGFVHFGIEGERKLAIHDMNGFIGLGTKPIKIYIAVPKSNNEHGISSNYSYGRSGATMVDTTSATDYAYYYQPTSTYSQNYNSWQGYHGGAMVYPNSSYYQQSMAQPHSYQQIVAQQAEAWRAQRTAEYEQQQPAKAATGENVNYNAEEDDYELVDYKSVVDVDKLNQETLDADCLLYDSLESSKWSPIDQLERF